MEGCGRAVRFGDESTWAFGPGSGPAAEAPGGREVELVGAVGEAAGDHGEDRLGALQVGRVGGQDVAGEGGQVGPLAGG